MAAAAVAASALIASLTIIATTNGCSATTHAETPSAWGKATSLDSVIDEPGPIEVETVIGADWQVPISGMVNLDHPAAKAAGIKEHDEPIQVAFHALKHPTRGTFLIDTGVEKALFDAPDDAAVRGIVASVANVNKMKRRTDTKTWIEANHVKVSGVFLTHLHVDHISGLRDVPSGTPVFVGPGEATARSFENLFVASTTNRALEGKPPLEVWHFQKDPDGRFEGVLDVFGDASVFALWVPGHTPGSTAFVARTKTGPILFTGDACHTTWGWEHAVEPGTFSSDKPRSADSLKRLENLASAHPTMETRVGHQLH